MEVTIKNTIENKLVGRKEISAHVAYTEAPPKRVEVRGAVAKAAGAEPGLVIIKKVENDFGARTMDCNAMIYNDEKTMNKFELKHLIMRSKGEKLKKEKKMKKSAKKK